MGAVRMNGKQLQDAVVDAARRQGWRVMHIPRARPRADVWATPIAYDGKGWPDLTLVRERIVFAEIKGDGDRITAEQQDWAQALTRAGQEVYLWRTSDWRNGNITDVLNRRAGS